jgi:hypothetical protein
MLKIRTGRWEREGGTVLYNPNYTYLYTTLYFVNQRDYKTQHYKTHALTHTRYFYNLNLIMSHLIIYNEGRGYLSVCAIAS